MRHTQQLQQVPLDTSKVNSNLHTLPRGKKTIFTLTFRGHDQKLAKTGVLLLLTQRIEKQRTQGLNMKAIYMLPPGLHRVVLRGTLSLDG